MGVSTDSVRGLLRAGKRVEDTTPTKSSREPKAPRAAVELGVGTVPNEIRSALVAGAHADPHTILGAHRVRLPTGQHGTAVRGFFPGRKDATLAYRSGQTTKRVEMKSLGDGLFEAILVGRARPKYHFEFLGGDGRTTRVADPYAMPVTIPESDRWLFNEGTIRDTAKLLGAREMTVRGESGFRFSVWAPNARGITVVGDHNQWNDAQHPMRRLGDSGLWELFVPGVVDGQRYQLRVTDANGDVVRKSDPAARRTATRPDTCSITSGVNTFGWGDDAWMKKRVSFDQTNAPVSVYEVHLGSWQQHDHDSIHHLDHVDRPLYEVPAERLMNYREVADRLVPYLEERGFTHVELLGLLEHPLDSSWGYQVSGYYAPTARHGSPDDFKYLVDRCHQAGIGVIMDWVPGHFPKDGAGLARFDGTHLFDHEDDRLGEQRDWNTRVYNYGRPEVQSVLLGSVHHMLDEYHLDGVRVDGVASMLYRDYSRDEWIPNEHGGNENLEAIEFLRTVNRHIGARFPGVLRIAEESTSFPGVTTDLEDDGLGFDTKWNMGWMNDTLGFFETNPADRGAALDALTNTFLWAHSERFVCSLSHDEVVHGKGSLVAKMPGADSEKLANLRLLYGFMWSYPGHKLLFMGQEFAQRSEWDFRQGLEWNQDDAQTKVASLVGDLNTLYRVHPALHESQFDPGNFVASFRDTENAVVGMTRKNEAGDVLFVHNVGSAQHETYRIGVDEPGEYRELLNTDDQKYGGEGRTNPEAVVAKKVPWHGKPFSIEIALPPLTTIAFGQP